MLPIHPVLLASFLWLSSYAANQDELFFRDVMAAGLVITGATALLVAVLWATTRNRGLSGIVAVLVVIGLAYYGRVFDGIEGLVGGGLSKGAFLALWCALFLGSLVYVVAKRSQYEGLTKTLNIVSLALIAVPLGTLLLGATGSKQIAEAKAGPLLPDPGHTEGPVQLPDIYYLVFDRYADNRTLQERFDFDNGPFLDALRRDGFYVTDRSRANYTKTAHSLASSLNLQHLDALSAEVGPGSSDWKPVYELLKDNQVARYLKAQGYRYVHLGSWWQRPGESSLADENFDGTPPLPWLDFGLNEFEWLLAKPSSWSEPRRCSWERATTRNGNSTSVSKRSSPNWPACVAEAHLCSSSPTCSCPTRPMCFTPMAATRRPPRPDPSRSAATTWSS